jgi:P pilus assembly chaperone PapD
MRKSMVFVLCFLVSTLAFVLLPAPAARASGWEWRQDDWSGGPGQALWLDDARYSASWRMDTTSVPGTMRMSYLSRPYTKDPSNPIVTVGTAGAWDDAYVFGFPRRAQPAGYEMMYRGVNTAGTDAVGYASSPNGVNWTKYAGNPVLQRSGAAPAWDQNGVTFGALLDEGDHFTMFFRGYDAAWNSSVGRATSSDLKSWQRGSGPVLLPGPAGAWDADIGTGEVMRDGQGYKIWYQGDNGAGLSQVGYATSVDGNTWSKSAANPVLRPGAGGSWDDFDIDDFRILARPWSGDYLMAYTGTNAAGVRQVGIAASPDGIAWTKDPGNPRLTVGGGGWRQSGLSVTDLVFDGSTYKMTLSGMNAAGRFSAGEAYSDDGTGWTFALANPVLSYSPVAAWDDTGTYLTSPFLEAGSLRAFYNGLGAGPTGYGIGTATCIPNYNGTAWLESSVFDAGSQAQWGNMTWNETVPAGCGVTVSVRTGDVPAPDGTWTAWTAVANGGAVPGGATRYIQYRVSLTGPDNVTPVVSDIAIDLNALPSTWYFAEGYTGSGFDEWITIQNPGAAAAAVAVTYFTPAGAPTVRNHNVPGNARYTIYVNSDLGANLENSFFITSSQRIIVERPMYFRYSGLGGHDWRGGHDAMGSTQLSRRWYFAEGYTGQDFEEWITIQNPNPGWATVDVTYYVNGGAPIRRQHRVAPASRYTISVNQNAGTDLEVSTALASDQPILAERPMYFAYQGEMDGGHIVMGSPYLAQDWYLAEGATFDPFTEYITIQNPNPAPATVAVSYYRPSGAPITRNHTVAANSRFTINAGVDSGVASDLSTYLHANQPILVERPMYFDMLHGGLPGGHCAVGVNSPSTEWYFGEGYTGEGFDEWLTVQNPGAVAANITVTYYVQGGAPITRNHIVQPQTRFTIPVNTDAGENLQLSAYVQSTQPVICERPMYFFYQGYHSYNWPGGHDSQGFAP